jgi:hypothetical protein
MRLVPGRLRNRSIATPLIASALVFGLGATAVEQRPVIAAPYVDCSDGRWTVGMNVPDKRDVPAGDIVQVDAIRLVAGTQRVIPQGVVRSPQTVGYLYTLGDRRTYVADRGRVALTIDSLTIMNDVVNDMSKFRGTAFDPRDDGSSLYIVTWSTSAAKRMGLQTARCPSAKRQ